MKYDLDKKIEDIKRSEAYTLEQIRTIKYAMGIIGIDEDLIMDPNIPSDYMDMYIRLMKKGIDVRKYINNWELNNKTVCDLEKYIIDENKNKEDIKNVTVLESTPVEDIKKAIVTVAIPEMDITNATVTVEEEIPKQRIIRRKNI